MRESKKTEKMHLPKETTEAWLETQEPVRMGVSHRRPPEDSFEVWVEKRVAKTIKNQKVDE